MLGSALSAAWTCGWVWEAQSATGTLMFFTLHGAQYVENSLSMALTMYGLDTTSFEPMTSTSAFPLVSAIAQSAISRPALAYGTSITALTPGAAGSLRS